MSEMAASQIDELIERLKDRKGRRPEVSKLNGDLIRAVENNDLKAIRQLLRQGADPNTKTDRPVLFACRGKAVIQLLVNAGADPGAVADGDTFGHYVIKMAYEGNVRKALEVLVTAGLDINARDGCGCTMLHWATLNKHVEVARWLLSRGAEIVADDHGSTPLHWASDWHRPAVVELLLDAGAGKFINAFGPDGLTPLLGAIQHGLERIECIGDFQQTLYLLFKAGAKLNVNAETGSESQRWDELKEEDPEIAVLVLEQQSMARRDLLTEIASRSSVRRTNEPSKRGEL